MEIQRIGIHKELPRKAPQHFRSPDESAVNTKKREDSKQRGELVRSTAGGDIVILSFKETAQPEGHKAIRPVESSLAKEDRNNSIVSGGLSQENISATERRIFFPLNMDTKSVADQNTIGKVTTDITGYAINKYREAWSYRFWTTTTLEVYA